MEDLTRFLKALADGNRLRLLTAIARAGELCACELTELLQVSGATCSRHLAILVDAGLLARRREGRWMHYTSAVSGLDAERRNIAAQAVALFGATDQGEADRAALESILARQSCGG